MVVLRKWDNSSDRDLFDAVLLFFSVITFKILSLNSLLFIFLNVYNIDLCNKDQTADASALGWFEISILDILN